ncbi:MAG: nucleotidyltransferase [Bacilli bacterium]|nr:nucleotidyltransferase [Bacilli bacterium]
MNKDLTLVIMAAGMGSRFGGLKQIEPIGPNKEFLIDYSIYDAIKAGFKEVVFIIKKENEEIFKETIGKRVEGKIPVKYVFQEISNLPVDMDLSQREKPLGTGHAIYCCKDVVTNPFAIINADDFYGRDAFLKIAEFLNNTNDDCYGVVGYNIANTLTENGSVKRGVCYAENGYLTSILESKVEKVDGTIVASPLNGSASFEVTPDTLVSMNMLGFTPKLFDYLEKEFIKFLNDPNTDLEKGEFLIPEVLQTSIKEDNKKVKVLNTDAVWYGVTYKEDKEYVVEGIKGLIDNGTYPYNLWK